MAGETKTGNVFPVFEVLSLQQAYFIASKKLEPGFGFIFGSQKKNSALSPQFHTPSFSPYLAAHLMAYAYMEQVRVWARRNRSADLVTAVWEAKDYILGVAV